MAIHLNPLDFDFAAWTQKIRDVKEFVLEMSVLCAFLANWIPRQERIASDKLRIAYKWLLLNPIALVGMNWRRVHTLKDGKHDGK